MVKAVAAPLRRIKVPRPSSLSLPFVRRNELPKPSREQKTTLSNLKQVYHPANVTQRGPSMPRRVDIISEQLCADAIKWLAPTLEKHRGCVLVDLHPGACLWSRKLHDFLQPRRHILVEPDPIYHQDFVQPLLEEKPSVYRHAPMSLEFKRCGDTLSTILHDRDLMPADAVFKNVAGPGSSTSFNNDILIVGNLARTYNKIDNATLFNSKSASSSQGFRYACAVAHHLMTTSLTRRGCHANGYVRSLLWMPSQQERFLLPASTSLRTSFNFMLAVAGTGTTVLDCLGYDKSVAERDIDEDNNVFASRLDAIRSNAEISRMHERVSDMPSWRQPILHTKEEMKHGPRSHNPLFGDLFSTIDELELYVDAWFARWDKTALIREMGRRTNAQHIMVDEWTDEIEFPQAAAIGWYARESTLQQHGAGRPPQRFIMMVDFTLRILRAEASFRAIEEQQRSAEERPQSIEDSQTSAEDAHLASVRTKIFHMSEIIDGYFATLSKSQTGEMQTMFSDILAIETQQRWAGGPNPIPRLPAYIEEFYPQYPMSLVDVQPSGRDLAVEGSTTSDEAYSLATILLKSLFMTSRDSVGNSLNRLAHGAADWIIPRARSLHDVVRGGRLKPETIHVRDLTDEQFIEITALFIDWPFRPSTLQMELSNFDC